VTQKQPSPPPLSSRHYLSTSLHSTTTSSSFLVLTTSFFLLLAYRVVFDMDEDELLRELLQVRVAIKHEWVVLVVFQW
jgi:hypothetical protein